MTEPTIRSMFKYPSYNVMDQQNHWDEHTRSIVNARLIRERNYQFLSYPEAEQIRAAAEALCGDDRSPIIQYVVCHIDESLAKPIGEGDRKAGLPQAGELVRQGLKLLNAAAVRRFQGTFISIGTDSQALLLDEISRGYGKPADLWQGFDQIAFFKKLLRLSLDAYYSHPTVWSEIGYGGPAYPRGYVRAHLNQYDPWEAQPNG